jgi:hypothetical protein
MNVRAVAVVCLTALIFSAVTAFAADAVALLVNGRRLTTDVSAQTVDGVTYLPLRATANALGAKLEWSEKSKTAALCVGQKCYLVRVSDPRSGARIVNGRTMVPLRKTAELLECKIDWDPKARAVIVTTPPGGGSDESPNLQSDPESLTSQQR